MDLARMHLDVLRGLAGGQVIWQPRIGCWHTDKVFAGQPLPEPYTGLTLFELYRALGCSARLYEFTDCFRRVEDARVLHQLHDVGDGRVEHIIDTPVGRQLEVLQSYPSSNPDKIVPYFISEVFPHGFAGLIIAAVLSLGLGGYSASLNSLATVTMVDLVNLVVPRFRRGDPQSPKFQHAQVFWSKALTVAFGALAVLIAWQAQNFGKIIDISMSLAFTFFGPVLGIFVSGIFWRRATSRGVFWAGLISACVGLYFMVFTAPKLYEAGGLFHFMASIMPDASVEGYKPLSRQWIMTLGVIGLIGNNFPEKDICSQWCRYRDSSGRDLCASR